MEELLVSFGINMRPLEAGMNRLRAMGKSWAAGFKADISGAVGRFMIAGLGIAGLTKLGQVAQETYRNMLSISMAEKQVGENANFIQNFNRKIEVAGGNTEEAMVSLTKFMQLVGRAQQGDPTAVAGFQKWGITVADEVPAPDGSKAQKTTMILKDQNKVLGETFDRLNKMPSVLERNAMASELFNKNWMTLIPIMESGSAGIAKLQESMGNLSESTIQTWTTSGKMTSSFARKALNETTNAVTMILKAAAFLPFASLMEGLDLGNRKSPSERLHDTWETTKEYFNPTNENQTPLQRRSEEIKRRIQEIEDFKKQKRSQGSGEQLDIVNGVPQLHVDREAEVQHQMTLIQNEKELGNLKKEQVTTQTKLLEEFQKLHENDPEYIQFQVELNRLTQEQATKEANISDIMHARMTVGDLADRAKKLLGMQNMPTGLNSIYTVTPEMAKALRISLTEDRAKARQAAGDNTGAGRLMDAAMEMRANMTSLTLKENQPLRDLNYQVKQLTDLHKAGNLKVTIQTPP